MSFLHNRIPALLRMQQQQPPPPPPPEVVVIPAASSFGYSCAVVSSPPRTVYYPSTRFQQTMITNDEVPSFTTLPSSLPPFRPRQPRADLPRLHRALRFAAIRSQQPPPASRAACARYRLGRRTAVRHVALTKRLDSLEKHIQALHTRVLHVLHVLDTDTLSSSTLASPAASATPKLHSSPVALLQLPDALMEPSTRH
jgi:hypothetical protein